MKEKKFFVWLLCCLMALCAVTAYGSSLEEEEPASLGSAAAYSFSQYMASSTVGYNVSTVYKNPGFDEAVIKVTYLSDNWSTNFLVTASDGQQITNDAVVPGNPPQYQRLTYYNSAHMGNVILRINTGTGNVGYVIQGYWSPDWHNYYSVYDFMN